MKGKIFLIIGIVLLSVIILVGAFYLFVLSGAIFMFNSNPPAPEITYGEFPIKVTCEINGKIKVIEDTVICEFDGFENLGSAGKYRKWKAYLKSGNERLTLLHVENTEIPFDISVSYGQPDYYMGDLRYESKEEYEKKMMDDRYLGYTQWENGVQTGCSIPKEEVWEKCKLKIIDIQYSPSIQNNFK